MARRFELPDQLFFKIGEVADIVGVKPHVLRYWESEFRQLRPMKTRGSHRIYKRRDVEVAMLIRRLLHDEGFTIAGAKKRLKELRETDGDGGEATVPGMASAGASTSVEALAPAVAPPSSMPASAAVLPLSASHTPAKGAAPVALAPSTAPLSRAARREATLRTELLTLRSELGRLLTELDRQARPEVLPQKTATVERVVVVPAVR